MFQAVTLVDHRPGEAANCEIVRARPVGRAYTWCDPTRPGAGGVSLLFKGEDGRWFIQQINHFPDPLRFFATLLLIRFVRRFVLHVPGRSVVHFTLYVSLVMYTPIPLSLRTPPTPAGFCLFSSVTTHHLLFFLYGVVTAPARCTTRTAYSHAPAAGLSAVSQHFS
jgi:hypothetical protein